MSFVTAAPDLVEAAAQDLAGIRSSLMEASASVAAPTTGVVPAAADEVSAGVAALFGNFGKEFQAVSAQAQAFHAEFVSAMNAGAAAYASTEAANAGQTLLGAVAAPAQALLGGGAALTTGQATPALIQGIESFGATVAAPYQQLVINTSNNLAAINQTFMANPFPFLNQVASNQMGFAQTFGAGLATSLQGFPANVPANVQLAIQGAMTFNPAALAQGFITQQQGYAFTIGSSLQLAGQDLMNGAPAFQAGVQAGFQDLLAGNPIGAYGQLNTALINQFLPSFTGTQVGPGVPGSIGDFVITPNGPLGALGPIFTIPGQMAQNFTNLLPPGSILAQMAQNGTNVVDALTNFNTTLDTLSLTTANLSFGAPVQLIFGLLGAPGNALSALNSSGVAFAGAMQAGNASAAAAAILDAPAFMANGFLNGTTIVTLPPTFMTISVLGVTLPTVSTVSLPLGGLLTPLSFPSAVANVDNGLIIEPVTIVGGTPVGGLIPAMLSVDSQLAQAIGGPAPATAAAATAPATAAAAAAPALAQGIQNFGAAVAAPYQALVANTVTNLQAINSTFVADPFPFLNQVASNQIVFAQTFGAGLATSLQGFPANVPANIQLAIQGASTFNPAALAQGFITQQQAYAQTISSSLQLAGPDFVAGLQTLPAGFQAAFQALLAGDNIGAYSAIDQALTNAFLPGFNVIEEPSGLFSIVPLGPLGDLAPIFTIPGQMAQNFTNLLPPGSILEQMAQNGTNLVNVFTNFGTTLDLLGTGDLNFGLPLQFIFDGIGGPGNALSALNSTGVAFATAVQAGNASAAAAAILDAPAVVTNGFLNGSTLINLPPASLAFLAPDIFSTVQIPLGGILTPLSIPPGFLFSPDDPGVIVPLTFGPGSTGIGGLIPGLLSFGPELAAAITPTM